VKAVILAGGLGTRLSELTDLIPKPMVTVGGKPILLHIMQIYAEAGITEFILALGYKADKVKDFFLNYSSLNSNFSIDLKSGSINIHENLEMRDWKVTLVDTGLHTMTGGRIRKLKKYIGKETFLVTYGDGLANLNIKNLIKFHRDHKKLVTVTAVRPSARFGELDLDGSTVLRFKEKPQTAEGWINGGFFVMEPEFIELIDSDDSALEKEPLERAAMNGQLLAYRHEGFWQCMDNIRDRSFLEHLWQSGEAPWKHIT
jgi:glucose-1-phosphate cytidylyltransferase